MIYKMKFKKKFIKKNNINQKDPKIRPTSYILRNIILICIVLFITCLISGILFGDNILSFVKIKLEKNEAIWLPILIFFGSLLLLGWGVITLFMGITSNLMKNKTKGIIINSKIRSFYDDDADNNYIYYVYSSVSYIVDGFEYQNEGPLNFYSIDNENKAIQKIKSISPGDKVLIFYDPKNPYLMTLESRDISIWGEIFTGMAFIGGGLYLSLLLGTFFS